MRATIQLNEGCGCKGEGIQSIGRDTCIVEKQIHFPIALGRQACYW